MAFFKRKTKVPPLPKIIKVEGGYQIEGKSGVYKELWQAEAHRRK